MPISSGSQPATARPRKMPSGRSPRCSASIFSISTHAEAPSESWLALPAVMNFPAPRTGSSFASPARVVSGRLPSSARSVTSSKLAAPLSLSVTCMVVVSGTISSSKRPACCAAAVRCWLSTRVLVLRLAADPVAFGDDVGRLDHRHPQRRLLLHAATLRGRGSLLRIALHQADRLDAAARPSPARGRRRCAARRSRSPAGPTSRSG